MNLRIHRTTASGKESLDIKDASESIAYAVLRRFLPEDKNEPTPTLNRIDVRSGETETNQSISQAVTSGDQLSNAKDNQGGDTPDETLEMDIPRILKRDVARTIIKNAQTVVRQETQSAVQEVPAEQSKYYPAKVVQKNGKDLYTIEVVCGACGHEGSRLTYPTNRFVKCRACDQKLSVEPMYEEPLAANKAGYAFKANAPFIHYRDQKELREEMLATRDVQ